MVEEIREISKQLKTIYEKFIAMSLILQEN
jgi:hypothetical protein